ncbi:alpha/beta hydrolase [Haloechinothrix sp. LS1_15]|uniref:alpha/beta hydrolase n=1 Tax=Haloechinothrix sp. LS1_15 TaxID=2652248 RepID=UPI0029452C65|nr:alpha/beta hydrolase [Haloechinothrix sp. LS1_15]MDV6013360.1 alpha/beta fold hydrolase [Haloechinothrix sp. LS1_15]
MLIAGCVAGPSDRPAIIAQDDPGPDADRDDDRSPDEVPLPPLGEPESPSLTWHPCEDEAAERFGEHDLTGSFEVSCATATGVLDPPGQPDRGMIRIALVRIGSGDIPLLAVNDIGGEPGSAYAARLAGGLPEEMLDEFSLVGVDRRYSGLSRPNDCIEPDTRERMLNFDPAADDVNPLLNVTSSAGQQCTIELANEQGALDTWRTAGDLEQIREQLGMPRLHAIASGEGFDVLDRYAQRYPDTVGRFVADGAVDPTDNAEVRWEGAAESAEQALDAFARDCEHRDCPLDGPARQRVGELIEQLRDDPLMASGGLEMGPGLALHAMWSGLGQRDRWPELADALAAARDGDAEPLAGFVEPMLRSSASGPPRLDTAWATRCNDTGTRLSPERINELSAEWREQYPVFGGLAAQPLVWCAPWPTVDSPGDDGELGEQLPPMLMISTDADPLVPKEGTERRAMQLPNTVTVAWHGTGRGALGHSACAAERVQEFLGDGEIPAGGTPCPA